MWYHLGIDLFTGLSELYQEKMFLQDGLFLTSVSWVGRYNNINIHIAFITSQMLWLEFDMY